MNDFKLRPHQEKAVQAAKPILERSGVVLLAMECRTGKTFSALELARMGAKGGRILFVTKKAAISSVVSDAEVMGLEVTVINYEAAHKVDFKPDFVVIDECHRVSAFPKMGKAAKVLREICPRALGVVLLSATPAIEAGSQWFHAFHVTGRGPFAGYASFYKWHKDFGIPAKIRIAGGQEVNDYSSVRPEVASAVTRYTVSMTQEEADFKVKAEVVPHLIECPQLLSLGNSIHRDGIIKLDNRTVVAESPAAILQKAAMACGSTLIDEDGEAFQVREGMFPKLNYIDARVWDGRSHAIFTQYIMERELLLDHFGDYATDDMEAFRRGEFRLFVGSIKSYCEGVDLSWLDGSMILYSLTFSGSTYAQILERMNNFKRTEPIKIHVLMIRGSVEESIFKAVSNKQNFNNSFLKRCRA